MTENYRAHRLTLSANRQVALFVPRHIQANAPVLVLAHGAGADVTSEFFQLLDAGLARFPLNRLYFNFPYRVAGKKMPDRLPVLQESWRAVIQWVTAELASFPVFIGGKSMGGRIASTIAGEYPFLKGLIFLGYPLHPPGKPNALRDAHLYPLPFPMLFVQGTRDSLAQFELIRQVVAKLGKRATMVVVEQGDHSFKIPRKAGKTYREVLYWVSEHMFQWIEQINRNEDETGG